MKNRERTLSILNYESDDRLPLIQYPLWLYCAGMIGVIRDWLGLMNMSYLMAGDELLFDGVAETVCELSFEGTKSDRLSIRGCLP